MKADLEESELVLKLPLGVRSTISMKGSTLVCLKVGFVKKDNSIIFIIIVFEIESFYTERLPESGIKHALHLKLQNFASSSSGAKNHGVPEKSTF